MQIKYKFTYINSEDNMFSSFIRSIFNSAILIPFILVIGINKLWIRKDIILGLIALAICLILIVAQFIILYIAKNKMIPMKVSAIKINQDKDNWVFTLYVTYLVPFFEGGLEKIFAGSSVIITLGGVIFLIFSSRITNNPILKLLGYRIYSVEMEQGVEMIFFTKKVLRNTHSLNKAIRLFDGYIMEVSDE